MIHIERCLRNSMENKKRLTWNRQMLNLIQEMILNNNFAPAEGIANEKISNSEARYNAIVQTATKEYADNPPSRNTIGIAITCSCRTHSWPLTTTCANEKSRY